MNSEPFGPYYPLKETKNDSRRCVAEWRDRVLRKIAKANAQYGIHIPHLLLALVLPTLIATARA